MVTQEKVLTVGDQAWWSHALRASDISTGTQRGCHSAELKVADRSAVGSALEVLQGVDELHWSQAHTSALPVDNDGLRREVSFTTAKVGLHLTVLEDWWEEARVSGVGLLNNKAERFDAALTFSKRKEGMLNVEGEE